ncbi:MAG: YitT family protein [Anaerotignum sp.]|nr:YitT family protein [Anaerotignum sp.]
MQNQSIQMIKQIFRSALGLFLYSCGVYLTVQANIGIAPWECLSMAISPLVGISFGIVHMISGIIILCIDLLMKEKIGFGTILDALLVGNYVDWIGYFDPVPVSESLPLSVLMVIAGLFVMGYGQYFYMSAGQSCGPRDSLTIAIGKRFPRTPIGVVQTVIVAIVLFAGWMLGGPIGIGTIISVFFAGTALQIVCRMMRFEPRNVKHLNVMEATKLLLGK